MKDKNEELLVDVFTGSPWEAELVKGLLESNGIMSSLKDDLLTTLAPYLSNGVVVQVNEEDYETAMEIVRDR
ncbi:DUF2007 domain-containing protein, partial [Bacteroides sp. OttesenSCG-928-N06]|nr:DUF2007 domain-containing protein [Bacteroides sp. OttesenSCG-928-N06]